jgi:hypothetical protein
VRRVRCAEGIVFQIVTDKGVVVDYGCVL